jgi:hypothetical protein
MNKKEIRKEIKKLEGELDKIKVPALVTNIDRLRNREQDVFEVDGIEIVDERGSNKEMVKK